MARVTVFIADDLLAAAEYQYLKGSAGKGASVNRSHMVSLALYEWATQRGRPEASGRGRIETLRTLRAAREALSELERELTQAKPVKRRVRRYSAPARAQRDT